MLKVKLEAKEVEHEVSRIIDFIRKKMGDSDKAVIGLSGGLDSDVTARLTVKAIGFQRIKFFTVIQRDMEQRHLALARELVKELGIPLIEIPLEDYPYNFMSVMEKVDPVEEFKKDGLLDPSRAKCSFRTVVLSTYQDRGYIAVGTSNRTELETGFFLPFGDALAHIKPIVHLYKTQVICLAEYLGTSKSVIDQPASAGFWEGQEDLEDLSYWLHNQAPIKKQIVFDDAAQQKVSDIRSKITTEKIDLALLGISNNMMIDSIVKECGLSADIVSRLKNLTLVAETFKRRPLGVSIED